MKRLAILIVCLPFVTGCMATQWLHDNPGVRRKCVTNFRQATRMNDIIMVEYDAYLRNISKRKNFANVRHTASIDLSRQQDDGRYSIEILESPMPPWASAGTSIPIFPDVPATRTRIFLTSDVPAAVFARQPGGFYLMLQSETTPETPELIQYYEHYGRYTTWWRPLVVIPAYPVAVVLDVVTFPIQYIMLRHAFSRE